MLNSIEQLKIIRGDAKPQETDLLSLLLQSGTIYGREFIINAKDTSSNADAEKYKTKMLGVIGQVFNNNERTINAIRRTWVAILGATSTTYSQVQGASDAQWIAFAQDQIDEAMEFVAGVSIVEKTAYNSL